MTKVLFISGPIGLGHIAREVKIVNELRRLDPSVEILWYAEEPASIYLKEAGEAKPFSVEKPEMTTAYAEKHSTEDYVCNLHTMFFDWRHSYPYRVKKYIQIVDENQVDLIVGDETMELMLAMAKDPSLKHSKLVIMTDFMGSRQISHHPKYMLGTYIFNRGWVKFMETPGLYERFLWIGEREDLREESMGTFLPTRKALGDVHIDCVGHIVAFDPKDYVDSTAWKEKLGYDPKCPLITCTVGGSCAGRGLLGLFSKSYSILRQKKPEVQALVVTGPNIDPSTVPPEEGMKVLGYVPKLYEHMAASDVVVTIAGGTTTLELTALNRPFLYFPLLEHFEQNMEVVPRLQRHQAGVKMDFRTTTPESLAKSMSDHLAMMVNYPQIPLNGAENAAKIIYDVLHDNSM